MKKAFVLLFLVIRELKLILMSKSDLEDSLCLTMKQGRDYNNVRI